MTNAELNTALYKKLAAEQEAYKKWLLTQPPEEILKNSYEFTVREDILLSLEYHDLTDAQASALLNCDSPLGIFLRILKTGRPVIWIPFLKAWKTGRMRFWHRRTKSAGL